MTAASVASDDFPFCERPHRPAHPAKSKPQIAIGATWGLFKSEQLQSCMPKITPPPAVDRQA